ncbi:exopolysaccharide biosynthesis protein exod [Loktanella sp. 5RATIMAR09]|uniref:exopolysaccharide biosynthesis protein n=1 Tax=Loktanella sp. 5RATIMAR09 TaxID=1225655 RepID=UPI0007078711|nr:exopolysaccharide biosynthesis protein [Loktanella sp. 5RATIMAR09]KQI70575.1 exopolysaccharide biosynthesis protein exod [Loktanella sp. 5RATIMAR09]
MPDAPPVMRGLTEIISQVIDLAAADRISLREVLRTIGGAGFAPILLLPALAVATPLSGIPFFSTTMGVLIFLVAGQMLLQRRHLWFPDWVLRREVQGHLVRNAFRKLYPVARWIDARTQTRMRIFAHRPLVFVPQILCLVSGLLMPVLEFVPFSSSILGVGVALLALGMLTRDGLLTIIGMLPYGVVALLIVRAAT